MILPVGRLGILSSGNVVCVGRLGPIGDRPFLDPVGQRGGHRLVGTTRALEVDGERPRSGVVGKAPNGPHHVGELRVGDERA